MAAFLLTDYLLVPSHCPVRFSCPHCPW
jgi:hypothetical protein